MIAHDAGMSAWSRKEHPSDTPVPHNCTNLPRSCFQHPGYRVTYLTQEIAPFVEFFCSVELHRFHLCEVLKTEKAMYSVMEHTTQIHS